MVPSSRKVTVPAGDHFRELTVASKVALLFAGFISGANETSVASAPAGAADTETLTGAEVLPANGPFALKAAVMLCAPVDREAVLKVEVPSAFNEDVPRMEFPS